MARMSEFMYNNVHNAFKILVRKASGLDEIIDLKQDLWEVKLDYKDTVVLSDKLDEKMINILKE